MARMRSAVRIRGARTPSRRSSTTLWPEHSRNGETAAAWRYPAGMPVRAAPACRGRVLRPRCRAPLRQLLSVSRRHDAGGEFRAAPHRCRHRRTTAGGRRFARTPGSCGRRADSAHRCGHLHWFHLRRTGSAPRLLHTDHVHAARREDVLSVRPPARKVLNWDEAAAWRASARGPVVFTNGVFDLLHPGHVDLLLAARAMGDALVVGVNTDASVRRLKGPGRPVHSEGARAYVLAALEAVDTVVLFPQDTPLELIVTLHPDVLVKGGDYVPDTIVGRREVEGWGGRVAIVPLTAGHSTTTIIETLRGPS